MITIVTGGILVTIPSCCVTMVKNFGPGILLGISALPSVIVFAITAIIISEPELLRQLHETLAELNGLLTQLETFVNNFQDFITKHNINVITDVGGNMSLDIPTSVDNATQQSYLSRIGITDRLIYSHIDNLESLLRRASELEGQIRELDSDYLSQLNSYRERLRLLISRYSI